MPFEYLIAALVLVVVTSYAKKKISKVIVFALNAFVVVFFTFNQVIYKMYFDNLKITLNENSILHLGIENMIGSYLAEIDVIFYVNILISFVFIYHLYKVIFDKNPNQYFTTKHKGYSYLMYMGIFLSFPFYLGLDNQNLENYPLKDLLSSIYVKSFTPYNQAVPTTKDIKLKSLDKLLFGKEEKDTTDIAKYYSKIKSTTSQPNIVYIILESIGAKNIFNKHLKIKNIKYLMNHSIIYKNMYASFPSTAKSHITLMTGGKSLTYGDVYYELQFPYKGPNIINILKNTGYLTGLFSAGDISFENRDALYANFKYDIIFAPNLDKEKYKVIPWGMYEQQTWEQSLHWLKTIEKDKIFFLNFMTVTSHHPYQVPEDFMKVHHKKDFPNNTRDDYIDYLNTIEYNDLVIGNMINDLKAIDKFDDTIFIIMGDHGEAFARYHKNNLLHHREIYDENIKSFLIISFPNKLNKKATSNKIISTGDINALITDLVQKKPCNNSLCDPKYQQKIVYFYKSSTPKKIGLRDGKFKYIYNVDEDTHNLFDMQQDTHEQHNIAAKNSKKTSIYKEYVINWYNKKNQEFTDYLLGYNKKTDYYKNNSKYLKDIKIKKDEKNKSIKITIYYNKKMKTYYNLLSITLISANELVYRKNLQFQSNKGMVETTLKVSSVKDKSWTVVVFKVKPEMTVLESGRAKITTDINEWDFRKTVFFDS